MAIEVQRYPDKGDPHVVEATEETLIVELPDEDEEDIEFQVGDDGNVIPMPDIEEVQDLEHNMNLTEVMDESGLREVSAERMAAFQEDKESREEWLQTFADGLDLLGIKMEERDTPFPGASGVTHPLLSEAATQFQAQAYKELWQSRSRSS